MRITEDSDEVANAAPRMVHEQAASVLQSDLTATISKMVTGIHRIFRQQIARWLATSVADEIGITELRERLVLVQQEHAVANQRQLATLQEIERRIASMKPEKPDYHTQGKVHPTATIGPEGLIENFRGEKEHITIGQHSYVRGRLLTYGHAGSIAIGDWCYVGVRTEIWSMSRVSIGNRVLISHNVNIIDGSSHSLIAAERHEHFRTILQEGHPRSPDQVPGIDGEPIIIEDDAWISFGATILKGVRIGKGSIVAAGSLVTKDVPPGMLYRCKVEPILTPLS